MVTDSAFQIAYRQEFVEQFEQHKSLLSKRVTTEFEMEKGQQAVFLVAGSNGATAVTRGVNGLIPARADYLVQNTCTLQEWHDLVRKTRFNIFASQGDQRAIMQMSSMGVINRKIDLDILAELGNGCTQGVSATASTASLNMVIRAKTILGNSGVPLGKNISAVISPAFEGYLAQTKEFGSAMYVNRPTTFEDGKPDYNDDPYAFYWLGVLWIVHPNVTGIGTNAEDCYMFHRASIGHATDSAGLESLVGYHEEQQYSWARTSVFTGTKTLQAGGMVQMLHDGSALATVSI